MSEPKKPGTLFVIGDVHGCAAELRALLHKLPLDKDSVLLFLGDYVDRGPDSKGVIDTVLDISSLYRVIALKGNHEWLFEQYLKNPADPLASSNFILNGGSATLASYSEDGVSYEVPERHKQFLASLELCHSTEKHFFVHAGIPPGFDFAAPIDTKTAHHMLWIRSTFLESKVPWPKVIVHGHTPVKEPEVLPHRINLDTGCVFGRSLTAMNMSTGDIYSVKRNQAADPKFLLHDPGSGKPRAQRYEGEVSVEVIEGKNAFYFRTVNFNEFGFLISPVPDKQILALEVGDKVEGLIKPGGDVVFRFQGTVMRVNAAAGALSYGVHFESLENLKEAE